MLHSRLLLKLQLGGLLGLAAVSYCRATDVADGTGNLLRIDTLWSPLGAHAAFGKTGLTVSATLPGAVKSCNQPVATADLDLSVSFLVEPSRPDGSGGLSFHGILEPATATFFTLRYFPGPPSRLDVGNRSIPIELVEEDFGQPLELHISIEADVAAIRRAGVVIATIPVDVELETAVVSVLAENATVTVSQLETRERNASGAPHELADLSLVESAEPFLAVPSKWVEYFGETRKSAAQMEGRWFTTIRGYSNLPDFSVAHLKFADAPAANAQRLIGPFSGERLAFSLDDVVNSKPGAGDLVDQVSDVIQHDLDTIYVTSGLWKPKETHFDKDRAYWLLRLLHERFPSANRHIYFQWGNEINGNHFDMFTDEEKAEIPGTGRWKFSNLRQKQGMFLERYLAPAVEAVRRASQDVYGDPRVIPVVSGSFANAFNPVYRQWMYETLDTEIKGEQAPSLKGKKAWELIDLLTIHYPLSNDDGAANLQEIWDRYGANGRIKGLWVTEQYGRNAGKGPITILEKGLEFVFWAAQNGLTAEQTRLIWWGTWYDKAGGKGEIGVRLLGEFLAAEDLTISRREVAAGVIYMAKVGDGRDPAKRLLALIPKSGATFAIADLNLELSGAPHEWKAMAVQLSLSQTPQHYAPLVTAEGRRLKIHLGRPVAEPLMILLTSDHVATARPFENS